MEEKTRALGMQWSDWGVLLIKQTNNSKWIACFPAIFSFSLSLGNVIEITQKRKLWTKLFNYCKLLFPTNIALFLVPRSDERVKTKKWRLLIDLALRRARVRDSDEEDSDTLVARGWKREGRVKKERERTTKKVLKIGQWPDGEIVYFLRTQYCAFTVQYCRLFRRATRRETRRQQE